MNGQRCLMVLLLLAFSAMGTLPSAYSVEDGIDFRTWVVAAAAIWITSIGVFWNGIRNDGAGGGARCSFLIALAWSVMAPYASTSIHRHGQADVGLGCTGLCFLFFNAAKGHWCRGLAYPIACVAGFSNLTTLAFFTGHSRGARRRTNDSSHGFILGCCGLVGIIVAIATMQPLLLGFPFQGAATGVHHDLWVLLPLLVLGVAGLLASGSESRVVDPHSDHRISVWAFFAMAFLAVSYVGVPLDARVSAYPFALLASRGLDDLVWVVKGCARQAALSRVVAAVSGMFLLVVAWNAMQEFAGGPLLVFHVFFG